MHSACGPPCMPCGLHFMCEHLMNRTLIVLLFMCVHVLGICPQKGEQDSPCQAVVSKARGVQVKWPSRWPWP